MRRTLQIAAVASAAVLAAAPAFAHPLPFAGAGFAAGFAHPFSGWDHMLAMTALGLWLGLMAPSRLPMALATFVAALALGFVLGLSGAHVPLVEPGILASVLVFALMAATALKLPSAMAAPVIALFTVFHGHAHGTEAPMGAATLYAAGFIFASVTIVTLACGAVHFIAVARREAVVRKAGLAIAAAGAVLGFVA